MKPYVAKLLKFIAVLLVGGMVFHTVAAAAHPAFCLDEYKHAGTAGQADAAIADSEQAEPADHSHHAKPDSTEDAAAPCHGAMAGCAGCLDKEATGLAAPDVRRIAFPHAADSFSSMQPGAAHRPPIAGA